MRKKRSGRKRVRGGVIKTFGDHLSLLPFEFLCFMQNGSLKSTRKKPSSFLENCLTAPHLSSTPTTLLTRQPRDSTIIFWTQQVAPPKNKVARILARKIVMRTIWALFCFSLANRFIVDLWGSGIGSMIFSRPNPLHRGKGRTGFLYRIKKIIASPNWGKDKQAGKLKIQRARWPVAALSATGGSSVWWTLDV